jgi:methylated-DNA-[protein]-cysteine S-methyltransferase
MFYDYFETGLIGVLTLAADDTGLRCVYFPQGRTTRPIREDWLHRPEHFREVRRQLAAYFKGDLKNFDLELAPVGTDFQRRVWAALTRIPYGTVVAYKSIAEAVGSPSAARAVGAATGRNPIPIIVPCHRVVGSNGSLTGFGGGLEAKSLLLDLEKRRAGGAATH